MRIVFKGVLYFNELLLRECVHNFSSRMRFNEYLRDIYLQIKIYQKFQKIIENKVVFYEIFVIRFVIILREMCETNPKQ